MSMEKVFLRPFHAPSVSISGFQDDAQSPDLQPYQMIFKQERREDHLFEYLPQRESVAILLFHRKLRRFMVLRRFRPEVFVSRVKSLPGNEGKRVLDIDWDLYHRDRGCTTELCTGRVEDKKKHVDETALAVLEEEFGYRVDKKYLKHVKTFVTGVTDSGAPCHIYYAELDNAEIVGEGRVDKIPEVQRVWLGMCSAQAEVKRQDSDSLFSTLHHFAFTWWFQTLHSTAHLPTMEESPLFGVNTRSAVNACREFEREMREKGPMEGTIRRFPNFAPPSRYPTMTMKYTIMGLDKLGEMTVRPDTVAVLIKDNDDKQWMMTRRFRPAVLLGRVMALPENEGKSLENIDFSAYPGMWAYTQELASGRIRNKETARTAVIRVAKDKLGYRIGEVELKFVARLLVGSSAGGESKHLFYAECSKGDRIEKWKEMEGVERVSIARWKSVLHLKSLSCPPSVFVVKQWLLWNERKETEAEFEAAREMRIKIDEESKEIERRWREEESARWVAAQGVKRRAEEEEIEKKKEEEGMRKEEEKEKNKREEKDEDSELKNEEVEKREGEGGVKDESEMRKRRNDASDEETETKRRRMETMERGEEDKENRHQIGNDTTE